MNHQLAKLVKNDITLIEYQDSTHVQSDKYFIQSGVVGFFATKKQLEDLHDILNYYLNMENFEQCKIVVDDLNISALPEV